MIECILVTKTDGTIVYSAHFVPNPSVSEAQAAEEIIYRLTNQTWNQTKGRNFEVAAAEGKMIVYTSIEDLMFFAVRSDQFAFEEDELSMMDLLNHIIDGLLAVCNKKTISAAVLSENYPLVCLTISEYVRDGMADQIDVAAADELAQYKTEKVKK